MRRVGNLRTARQVIQPVQTGRLGDRIHASQQQIDVIRLPASQTPRQLAPDEAGHSTGSQVRLVAHRVQCNVCLDELCKLDSVACFSGESEKRVLVQLPCLVIGGLEDRGASHGSFGGGNDGEVAASEAK